MTQVLSLGRRHAFAELEAMAEASEGDLERRQQTEAVDGVVVPEVGQAKDAAASAYLNTGAKALQTNKMADAIENLNASLTYNDAEPKAYYYLALAYNGSSKWDDAITAANKPDHLWRPH